MRMGKKVETLEGARDDVEVLIGIVKDYSKNLLI